MVFNFKTFPLERQNPQSRGFSEMEVDDPARNVNTFHRMTVTL